jgi:hypothetical protein
VAGSNGIDAFGERIFMTESGNIGNKDAKAAELPKAVHDTIEVAVYKAVRRSINGLKREVEAKRPRMVTEKHIHFSTKEFTDTLLALRQECDRAETLLAKLRAEREQILRIIKPELFI